MSVVAFRCNGFLHWGFLHWGILHQGIWHRRRARSWCALAIFDFPIGGFGYAKSSLVAWFRKGDIHLTMRLSPWPAYRNPLRQTDEPDFRSVPTI